MILLSALALADGPTGSSYAALGNRLDGDGLGGSASVNTSVVIGGDGGTIGTTLTARYGAKRFVTSIHLPFAGYRDADGREANLGNVRVEGYWRKQTETSVNLFGVEVHLPTGRAYTWTNDASSFWRSGGMTAVFQRRQATTAGFDVLIRGSLGLHATPGYAPFPRVYPHVSMAVGMDHDLSDEFGYTTEAAFSAWRPRKYSM